MHAFGQKRDLAALILIQQDCHDWCSLTVTLPSSLSLVDQQMSTDLIEIFESKQAGCLGLPRSRFNKSGKALCPMWVSGGVHGLQKPESVLYEISSGL